MSGLSPSGPAQPSLNQAYETKGNPADKEPAEKSASNDITGKATETRVPQKQSASSDEATSSSLGRGIHGAPPGEEAKGYKDEDFNKADLEGEQMRAPGEGDVNDAVQRKPGASGEQEDFTSDLDKKKAEQAPAREAKKNERAQGVDVDGALAAREHPV